jgi:hypothetical protein
VKVELEVNRHAAPVEATADNLVSPEVHRDFPTIFGRRPALEADPTHVGERLEQLGDGIDKTRHPLRSSIPLRSETANLDLADEVSDGQVRVRHESCTSKAGRACGAS